ncbi:HNH endonuclease family protein [Phycicoccus sonneratiae]|uniref:HNH endonuclease n=1 Tax=Phycicoccus sonneratiae TaxID=2807628 RepID=A0ABS2CFY7_9MICO|nr:HNH endonuclease family protein [Phycicoccus sonneraticus]MBM6398783.1 HNH endonuclease [Phycicoccus sonneraticus]
MTTSTPPPSARPTRRARTALRRTAVALGLALAGAPAVASAAQALPPAPPSVADSRTMLAGLHVGYEDNVGYDRTEFKHWITISGSCDTRETVLERDGSGVTTDSTCHATGGTWRSVYDDTTFTNSSDLDIDHVVPLAEAWGSGANLWTDAKREVFANDLSIPQLIAVSASSNRSKSDQDPAEWQPPASGWRCEYARSWIEVKDQYDLEVDSAEKTALTGMLDTDC